MPHKILSIHPVVVHGHIQLSWQAVGPGVEPKH